MEFDHTQEKTEDAVIGTDRAVSEELLNELVNNPLENLGEKPSESAEWIYDNVEDPNALVVMSILLTQGIHKIREDHIKESMKDMPDDLKDKMTELIKLMGKG